MVKTTSSMLPLGTSAPLFSLPNVVSGQVVKLTPDLQITATVIMFICNHCPYVKHIRNEIIQVANDYQNRSVRFFAINSNNANTHPDDSPENMKKVAEALHFPFPYLYDETQEVAKAYQAACTPDFFVFDRHLSLTYRGQFDDSRPGNDIAVNGKSLRMALDCMLNNEPLSFHQTPSLGCNIKWYD